MNSCELSVVQKIGQRFAAGISGIKLTAEFKLFVKKYKTGNVILFRENLQNAEQAKALCKDIRSVIEDETGLPPFITLDQEGGCVTRLPKDMVNVPGAMALAASGNTDNVKTAAQITACELRRIGINFNLAPVLDINSNRDNPVIGNRSFGESAEEAVPYAAASVKAFLDSGLLCCGKHFPGHGATAVDSHLDLPVVNRSYEELEARELKTFRAAIEAGIPAIMTSHILFPQIESERIPATMSKKILTEILRNKLGFDGLILSDGMEMNAIAEYYGIPAGCVKALDAGADIVFVCHGQENTEKALNEVSEKYAAGFFDETAFETSVERIVRYKKQFGSFGADWTDSADELQSRIKQNAVLMRGTILTRNGTPPPLGENPFFAGCRPYRSTIASSKQDDLSFAGWFAERFGGNFAETPVNPNDIEISKLIAELPAATSIVIGTYNGHLNKGQIKLAFALFDEAKKRNIPFTALALRNPWDIDLLPKEAFAIKVWEYSINSFEAVADLWR